MLLTSGLSGSIINGVPVASARISGKPGGMNNFTACRGSPLGLLPGQTVAAEGFTARWTAYGSRPRARNGRLGARTGRPKNVKETCQMERKSLELKQLQSHPVGSVFMLGRPALSFRQVS